MKKSLLLSPICFACVFASAQDTVVLRNGEVIVATIDEIAKNEIRYKPVDQPDGPFYVVHLYEVSSYTLKDGNRESIGPVFETIPTQKNFVAFNAWDLTRENLSASYERFLDPKSSISVHVPVRIGFDSRNASGGVGKNVVTSGAGLRYFAVNNARLKFYFGPEMEYSLRKRAVYNSVQVFDPYGGYYYTTAFDHDETSHYLAYYFVTGMKYYFQPNVGFNLSVGYGRYDNLQGVGSTEAKKADIGFFFAF